MSSEPLDVARTIQSANQLLAEVQNLPFHEAVNRLELKYRTANAADKDAFVLILIYNIATRNMRDRAGHAA